MTHHRKGLPSLKLQSLLEILPDKYKGVRTYDQHVVDRFLETLPAWRFDEIKFLVALEAKKPLLDQRSIRTICAEYARHMNIFFIGF